MHGWIILDKPHGLGSTQAVSAVKRVLRQSGAGKGKVGHGGTLDPLATGVLPLCLGEATKLAEGVLPIALGEATKLAGRMLDSDKVYEFTVAFGVQTDTLDLEGETIATSDHRPTRAQVDAILPRFTGPIEQVPPAYSAILIDGQRAYDLARDGEDFELTGSNRTEDGALASLTLTAHVSKGTYIRSLARDIALALGTVGHVTMLRRVKAGPFTLDSAISLDILNDAATGHGIAQYMLPLTAGLDDIPALSVSPDEALALRQGKMLIGKPHTGLLLAMLGETPIALVESSGPDIRVVRGFNL